MHFFGDLCFFDLFGKEFLKEMWAEKMHQSFSRGGEEKERERSVRDFWLEIWKLLPGDSM